MPFGRFTVNSVIYTVCLTAGEFVMGRDDAPPKSRAEWEQRGDWDEVPAHKVRITKPFYLGVHEVTNAQYEQFDNPHVIPARLDHLERAAI